MDYGLTKRIIKMMIDNCYCVGMADMLGLEPSVQNGRVGSNPSNSIVFRANVVCAHGTTVNTV